MGRPEKPVDRAVPERAQLAEWLRARRQESGLTYDELATATGLSAATLKRAASGRDLPRRETVLAFLQATGGDYEAFTLGLWLKARIADRGRLRTLRRPPTPALISHRSELSAALEYLYEACGAPSLRELQQRAGGSHVLPVSTAARVVSRQALPASRQQFEAFLRGCGVASRALADWLHLWDTVAVPADEEALYGRKLRDLFGMGGRGASAAQQAGRSGRIQHRSQVAPRDAAWWYGGSEAGRSEAA
ncbi:helix-turn-helix domain-containing protein [Streptomyces sp. NPDC093225]|uniref:helix-turn-helix domain-containing protein n=1 Tax=Streptomyces sp. NPDC093225 TaxID=3366034 RepID=UPI00382E50D5